MNHQTSKRDSATDPGSFYVPFGEIASSLTVDEDGIRGGLAGGPNDHLASSSSHQGRLPYNHGVHGPSATTPFSWSTDGLPRLTSGQQSVHYHIADGGRTLLAETLTGEPVWHLALTDLERGTYRFSLLGALDHPMTTGEDDLAFSIPYAIEDSQGHKASSRLGVIIDDDSPSNGVDAPVAVDAGDHITGFWHQKPGADGYGSTAVQIANETSGNHPIGTPITTSVGTLTVFENGNWRFHAKNSETDASLDFAIVTTDGDGDVALGEGQIEIIAPIATTGPSTPATDGDPSTGMVKAVIDEDGLAGGIDGGLNDAARVSSMTTGSLGYSVGSAGLESFEWHTDQLPNLASQGHPLNWSLSDNGRILEGSSARDAQSVISIQLTQASRGEFTIALFQPLDHTNPLVEDDLRLALGYTLHDQQGRGATGSLSIVVDDDRPDLVGDQAVILSGRTLVTNVLANDALGAEGGRLTEAWVRGGKEVGNIATESTGNVIFTPRSDFIGTADIHYRVVDGDGDAVDALLSVNVSASRALTTTELLDFSRDLPGVGDAPEGHLASAPELDTTDTVAVVFGEGVHLEQLREASMLPVL